MDAPARKEERGSETRESRLDLLRLTWTPKVCKIMAFMAIIRGFGLLFYLLLGSR